MLIARCFEGGLRAIVSGKSQVYPSIDFEVAGRKNIESLEAWSHSWTRLFME